MHCTDFLGCQQCREGTRTYDESCDVWYCDSGSNFTGCSSTKPTATPTDNPTGMCFLLLCQNYDLLKKICKFFTNKTKKQTIT